VITDRASFVLRICRDARAALGDDLP
jgi:hypothetical protein